MKYLITGGAGSLGKAITKMLLHNKHNVAIFSRDEGKHALTYGNEVEKFIGDVRDFDRFDKVVKMYLPDRVIHAAALKRIDDLELHPEEAHKTNVLGSENVARACVENGIQRAILVSTDKACKPVNVYGACKFVAERTFTNWNFAATKMGKPCILSSVRYGNVIASRGSFIPSWEAKIRSGKPIQITDKQCTRYLFTLRDAAATVLFSLDRAHGGEVFVPSLDSFRIEDVAVALAELVGKELQPSEYTGLRQGEKLHEDMLSDVEAVHSNETLNTTLETWGQATGPKLVGAIMPEYFSPRTPCPHVFPYYFPHTSYQIWKRGIMNSGISPSADIQHLKDLIVRGLNEAE